MMNKMLLGALTALCILSCVSLATTAMAADHLDAPGAQQDSAADINDVYVFRSKASDAQNTRRTVLVMTVIPAAGPDSRLSSDVTYEFWIKDTESDARYDITCTATEGPDQSITCNGPADSTDTVSFNTVDAGNGNQDAMRIFVGLREDPFFFDLEAFRTVLGSVLDGTPDPSALLDDQGTDFFAPLNTVAIVVDVQNVVFGDATTLAVYGRTIRNGLK